MRPRSKDRGSLSCREHLTDGMNRFNEAAIKGPRKFQLLCLAGFRVARFNEAAIKGPRK